jgi:hypothetical protein
MELFLTYEDNWYRDMPDDEDGQPRSGVIGAKMTISFAAYGTTINDFEVVVQQPALAASRASPERASQERCER